MVPLGRLWRAVQEDMVEVTLERRISLRDGWKPRFGGQLLGKMLGTELGMV